MIHRYTATFADQNHDLAIEGVPDGEGQWRITLDSAACELDVRRIDASSWSIMPRGGGRAYLVDIDRGPNDAVATLGDLSWPVKLVDRRRALQESYVPARTASGPQPLRAPMPGKVIKLLVAPGAGVTAGQGVVIVEAMKMENEMRAPRDGTISEIKVREGQAVEAGETLAVIA